MELWIRSQDKELLVLAKGFEFQHVSYDGSYQIFAVWQNNYQMVGKYKNKKRALEVLDEIQKIINGKTIINFKSMLRPEDIKKTMEELGVVDLYETPMYDIKQLGDSIVYEMPKE